MSLITPSSNHFIKHEDASLAYGPCLIAFAKHQKRNIIHISSNKKSSKLWNTYDLKLYGWSLYFDTAIWARGPGNGVSEPEAAGTSPLNSVSDNNVCPIENKHFIYHVMCINNSISVRV